MPDSPDNIKAQIYNVATTPVFVQYLCPQQYARRIIIQNPAGNADPLFFCTSLGGAVIEVDPGFFFTIQFQGDSYNLNEKIGYLKSANSEMAQVFVTG
jgi:hypothetical protein